ncbi:MATE family efflux transporter [Anaerotruncus sp. 1XD42-93]|uniref:MATE family efflux transporter n=1 Tax=Anaerotruncus sp. 1XD42-93 TaxID=2320853 RepID=UPI001FA95903|nr:MATE family efflux transporter [Anaerotruncus sp. 1XD42-93]
MDDFQKINSRRYLVGLTWPIFVELVLQMLVSNVDQIMVAKTSETAVAAIGNANVITTLLVISFSVICMAATILVTQYIGAGSTGRVAQTYTVSLLVNFLFSLAIGFGLAVFPRQIFGLMGVPEQLMQEACAYLRIIGLGMPLQAIHLTFVAFFRANGLTRQTMFISIVINFINIGGNLILINGFGPIPALGIVGAAVSSDLSRLAGVFLILDLFRRHIHTPLSLRHLRPFPFDHLKRLLKIGIPSGGESVSYNLTQIVIQTVCNSLPVYVITSRVYCNMFAMLSYIYASAIAQATQIIVGYLMGARRIEETDKRVNATLWGAMGVSFVISLSLYLFCRPLFGLFTNDPQVLDMCKTIMGIEIFLELGRAANIVLFRSLQTAGDIRFPICLNVTTVWVVAAGGGYLLGVVLGWGLPGVWIAMASDEIFRGVVSFFRWKSGKWRSKHLID